MVNPIEAPIKAAIFGNLTEFSICFTFFFHIKSLSVPYNTKDMPEADFATVGGGGGGTGIRDSLRSLSNNAGDGYQNVT